jgi:hypothetical protein
VLRDADAVPDPCPLDDGPWVVPPIVLDEPVGPLVCPEVLAEVWLPPPQPGCPDVVAGFVGLLFCVELPEVPPLCALPMTETEHKSIAASASGVTIRIDDSFDWAPSLSPMRGRIQLFLNVGLPVCGECEGGATATDPRATRLFPDAALFFSLLWFRFRRFRF